MASHNSSPTAKHFMNSVVYCRQADAGTDQHDGRRGEPLRRADQPRPPLPGRPHQAHPVREHCQGKRNLFTLALDYMTPQLLV